VTQENAPNGDTVLLAQCDTVADPEDGPDGEGFDFIDRVTHFQRFLAAPPQTPRSGMSGETQFNNAGCVSCHVASFQTPDDAGLEDAIRNKTVKPYSDFLLHDMGLAADFIEQGAAGPRELRTPPLWGLRVRDPLWHDGRVAGGTFESRMLAAIAEHDSLNSEAEASAQAFNALLATGKDALVAFLDSLGRAEFDHDGDNDVDAADYLLFDACFTGPGSFYTADDACAIFDVDQDGDVDDDDFDVFLAAAEGDAGEVPGDVPASQLTVNPDGAGNLILGWGVSCLAGDVDYEVYEGTLGDFASHDQFLCGTGGTTSATFGAPAGSVYYLVVPSNGFREGSYGVDGAGAPRPAGVTTCLPQSVGTCQ